MTSCGETSERLAAGIHLAVAALYITMLLWHVSSAVAHWNRE